MVEKRKMPDGPESSAGDDFHILWAVRKSLELFNFEPNGLKALTIEGGVSEDAKTIDPDGDQLLGVDVGEYYGGEDFKGAYRLVFTQLKYSTRHPSLPWTIARICQGKKYRHKGSIIHRLASIYKAHLEHYDETVVIDKLRLKLVSNRPADVEVLELIKSVKRAVDAAASLASSGELKKAISSAHHDSLERIKDASGLPAKDLSGFISMLDFSDCGTSARSVLREKTIWAINKVNSVTQIDTYNSLYVKISSKMMPENQEDNKLTIIDMIKIFHVGSVNQLFPVPASFETRPNLIRRLQIENILEQINSAGRIPACLHGGAGMGKSSVVQQLKGELPEGSVVIMFDCYGGGAYLDPDDARHKPDWALKQIANEMALAIGSDFFLLPAGQPPETYYREFRMRLVSAVKILQETHPNALLVLVIDAADNSITAAGQKGERSFVLDIVNLILPTGCRLLVTTRSYRLATLQLPEHVLIELQPFEKEETRARLQLVFPEVKEEQSLAFHQLTYGIPRVQTYALVNHNDGIEAILEPLKPSGKKLDDLMRGNVEFVKRKLGDREKVDRVLLYLINLPRPVSSTALAELSGTTSDIVIDIITDTGQGIVLSNEVISLTDEDFEDFLKRSYPANINLYNAIADYFLCKAEANAYASRHLGNALRLAGRYETLKQIVFSGEYLLMPQDPVALKGMAVERTMSAMRLSIIEKNPVDFLKLQLAAAEAAKTNDLLEQTLLANADLTTLYGDKQTIEKLLQTDSLTWYGPVHYRCAAIYARNKGTIAEAREHFKAARSWMDWRDRQNTQEVRECRMSKVDFVFAAEATCRLVNLESALDLLFRYNFDRIGPLSQQFLQHMLIVGATAEVDQTVKDFKWSIRGKLNITKSYFRSGRQSLIEMEPMVNELLARLAGRRLLRDRGRMTILELAEYLSWQRYEPSAILELLSYVVLKSPRYFPRFYASNFKQDKELAVLDVLFKAKCMIAVWLAEPISITDFYSDKIKSADPKRYDPNDSAIEERRRADILFASVVPLYMARAQYFAGKLDETELLDVFQSFPKTQHRNYELHRYHRELPYFRQYYAETFSDLALYVSQKGLFCKALLEAFATNDNSITVRLDIATKLSRLSSGHLAAMNLLSEAAAMIFNSETGAGAKIDSYLRCVRIGTRLDLSVGGAYFKKMIDTIGEMDLEGFDQVRLISQLSRSLNGRYPKTSFDFARFIQFAYSRLQAWDHFPWQEGIEGVGSLDHFGVWATLARWDHLNLVKADDYMLTACESALRRGLLPPATHAAFLTIAGHYPDEFSRQLNILIEKTRELGQVALSAIGNTFYRLIRFECVHYRIAGLLAHLKCALEKADCGDKELITLIEECVSKDNLEPEAITSKVKKRFDVDPSVIIPSVDWSDRDALKNILKKWCDSHKKPSVDFLVALRSKCNISEYVPFLTFLTELDDELLYYFDRETLLADTLALWKDHPALPEWKCIHFVPYLERAFPIYTEHRDILNTPSLGHIAKLFEVSDEQLADGIKAALAKNIERLDASIIYQLGSFTKIGLKEAELLDVIEWALERWISKMPNTWHSTQWEERFYVANNPNEAAASLIRYLLGHPRKELRWRTLHGLRLTSKMGNHSVLQTLLGTQDEKLIVPFQHEPYTFYWISAKLWLWILLKKLAEERIAGVSMFANDALHTLNDSELPHALIRYHVQKFCLAVEEAFPKTFTATQIKQVTTALLPSGNQKKVMVKTSSLLPINKLKFHFDTTDTVPYWYQPLCSVFEVPYLTVPNWADEVITKILGYTGKTNEEDHVRVDQGSYSSASNGHGDIPSVEVLRHYYEFHAMFCVASGLLNEASPKSETAGELKEWLEGWNTTFEGLWLSDLRDVTPQDDVFNVSERPPDWQDVINDSYAASYLQTKRNWVAIAGDIKLIYGTDYETVRISSALVGKEKARSLLYTLQDMPLHRYRLPEDGEDAHEVNEDGFLLEGWYSDISGRNEVHDRLDPLANKLKQHYLRISERFMNWSNSVLSKDFKLLTGSDGNVVGRFENWDDSGPYPDSREVETRGQRLSIEPSILLGFLQEFKYSLIVEVKIDRDEQRRSYGDDDNRLDIELKNIYLIEADGTIKTIGGDLKLR